MWSGVNMIQHHTDALLHYCLHAGKNMTIFIIRLGFALFGLFVFILNLASRSFIYLAV